MTTALATKLDVKLWPLHGGLWGIKVGEKYRAVQKKHSRFLAVHGRLVIKIGSQSRTEADHWEQLSQMSEIFWPIVGHGQLDGTDEEYMYWVAQEILPIKRALRETPRKAWLDWYPKVKKEANRCGVADVSLEEEPDGNILPWNWTLYRGKPVIFDYGMTVSF